MTEHGAVPSVSMCVLLLCVILNIEHIVAVIITMITLTEHHDFLIHLMYPWLATSILTVCHNSFNMLYGLTA